MLSSLQISAWMLKFHALSVVSTLFDDLIFYRFLVDLQHDQSHSTSQAKRFTQHTMGLLFIICGFVQIIIGRLRIQFKREIIYSGIKRSTIFLVNPIYELEPCLAISFEIATQSGQEFSLKNRQFKMRALNNTHIVTTH